MAEEEWVVGGGVTSPGQLCCAEVSRDGDFDTGAETKNRGRKQ